MKSNDQSGVQRLLHDRIHIPLIYGVVVACGLILYFFFMKLIGLAHLTYLRAFNLPIFVIGVYFAYKQYRNTHHGKLDYFHAMLVGPATAFVSSTIFALFIFTYLKFNPDFMKVVMENTPMGEYLNTYMAAFALWFEGLFTGYSSCFLLVNWLHTDKVESVPPVSHSHG